MRINVYADETNSTIVTIQEKTIEGHALTGVRFNLPGEKNSVTFWGRQDMVPLLEYAIRQLQRHYEESGQQPVSVPEERHLEDVLER